MDVLSAAGLAEAGLDLAALVIAYGNRAGRREICRVR